MGLEHGAGNGARASKDAESKPPGIDPTSRKPWQRIRRL